MTSETRPHPFVVRPLHLDHQANVALFPFILKQLAKPFSLARAFMHFHCMEMNISGNVVDIGSNRGATYLKYIKKADATIVEGFDLKESKGVTRINFETDPLPRADGSADHVLMFNVLEHIFHHQFLMNECARILKKNGKITGFVPFLVNYHPDPHDYFRYTFEALTLILKEAGFINVRVAEVGRGPFMVNLNNFVPSLSRYVSMALFPIYYLLDSILLVLRPNIGKRYPLGYVFSGEK